MNTLFPSFFHLHCCVFLVDVNYFDKAILILYCFMIENNDNFVYSYTPSQNVDLSPTQQFMTKELKSGSGETFVNQLAIWSCVSIGWIEIDPSLTCSLMFDFMLEIVNNIRSSIRKMIDHVPLSMLIHLIMDNTEGHGTESSKLQYISILREDIMQNLYGKSVTHQNLIYLTSGSDTCSSCQWSTCTETNRCMLMYLLKQQSKLGMLQKA